MQLVHQLAFYLHASVGTCALLLFWIPVATRKGNLNHRRFGRLFASAMYMVAGSGAIMATLDLVAPLTMHAAGMTLDAEAAAEGARNIRGSALFLLSLSILVLTSTRQGWLAIRHKADRAALRRPAHLLLCLALIAVGITLLIVGLMSGRVLFLVFAVLEVISGVNCLRYSFKAELDTKEWWIEHFSGLIGSGVGAYVAFFVFGGSRLLASVLGSAFDDASLFLWLTPAVVGGLAVTLLSRHYRARFNGSWAVKRASLRNDLVR